MSGTGDGSGGLDDPAGLDGPDDSENPYDIVREAATRLGLTVVPVDMPIPAEVAAECPDAQAYQTPWGLIIRCPNGRLWRRDPAGGWEAIRWPSEARQLIAAPPTPPREPDPPPPDPAPAPGGFPVKLVAALALAALIAVAVAIVLRSGDDDSGERADVVGQSSTTSTTSSGSTASTTSSAPGPSSTAESTSTSVTGGSRLPADIADRIAEELGLDPAEVAEVDLMEGSPEWQSANTPPASHGAGIESYGALRLPEGDLFVIVLDQPAVDTDVEGAGTQVTVGRGPAIGPVEGPAGFATGYDELFFLTPAGGLDALRPPDYEPLGFGRGTFFDARIAAVLAPVRDDIVRFGNFNRVSEGDEASADDPTEFQISEPYRLTDDGLVPAG